MEQKKVELMAKMLRQGSTMLDLSCPQCKNILFRRPDGKIFCPICEQEVVILKSEKNRPLSNESVNPLIQSMENPSLNEMTNFFQDFLVKSIAMLKNAEDQSNIEHILNQISQVLDIIQKLRDLQR